jgi:5-formyltetrahydrofolate cyclo-ligase
MNAQQAKQALRQRIRDWREGISAADREAWSRAVADRVRGLDAYRAARTVLVFAGIGTEVATDALVRAVASDRKRLVMPRVGEHDLVLHAVADPERDLAPGVWGIPEPGTECPEVAPEAVDLFLLPGLAFDPAGGRLGYGRGYFDRVLARAPGTKVALAFDGQVVDAVPRGPGDVPVDLVVTPTRVLRCSAAPGAARG